MRSSRLLVARGVLGAPRSGTSRQGPSMRTRWRRRALMVPPLPVILASATRGPRMGPSASRLAAQ
eukprot:3158037-Pyramimonas_sp.AAC.1